MRAQLPLACLALCLVTACSTRGYKEGNVTTTSISHSYEKPAVIPQPNGMTYTVAITGVPKAEAKAMPTLDQAGMKMQTGTGGQIAITISIGAVRYGEPGAIKLGAKHYPAIEATVPYDITITHAGAALASDSGTSSQPLTLKNFGGFPTREEAVGTIGAIKKLSGKGLDERCQQSAVASALKDADGLCAMPLRPRMVNESLPIVKMAGECDMSAAYDLARSARQEADYKQALAAYKALGTQHMKLDGTPDIAANYGVLCSMSTCLIKLGAYQEAYQLAADARKLIKNGDEAAGLVYVLYRQEKNTGTQILSQADRDRADSYSALHAFMSQ